MYSLPYVEVVHEFCSQPVQPETQIPKAQDVISALQLKQSELAGNLFARMSKTLLAQRISNLEEAGHKVHKNISLNEPTPFHGPVILLHFSSTAKIDNACQILDTTQEKFLQAFWDLCAFNPAGQIITLVGALQSTVMEVDDNAYTFSWKQRVGFST